MLSLRQFVATAGVAATFVVSSQATAGTLTLRSCAGFGDTGLAYSPIGNGSFSLANRCDQGGSLQIGAAHPGDGESGSWIIYAPSTISIVGAATPSNEVLVDPTLSADGYSAKFLWRGGSQSITPTANCCGGLAYGTGIYRSLPPSPFFAWQVTCDSSCYGSGQQLLDIRGIALVAEDNTAPTVTPAAGTNLWSESGQWVRGSWPLGFSASDDSGICNLSMTVGSTAIQGPQSTPNQHNSSWTECPSPQSMSQTIDTTKFPDGPLSLGLSASDAASPANVGNPTESVNVDNQPVTLALSGPADVPASPASPTATVTATATSGPSGFTINCSVDGGPTLSYTTSPASIPVSGYGAHQVSCSAHNNAIAQDGTTASAAPATWNLSIREPSEASVAFESVVDALRCGPKRERVTIPAHTTTVVYNGRSEQVNVPAETRTVTVVQCHPQVVVRRIRIGRRYRRLRTVLVPHLQPVPNESVGYGQTATVRGWLGNAAGLALGGQPVQIYTAPADGHSPFSLATSTTTASDGSWQVTLPAGPSRHVTAVYPGSAVTEPTMTPAAELTVPTQVSLRVGPTRAHWGHSIRISGSLAGGYVPPAGEVVVVWIGWRGGKTEIDHLYTDASGNFATRYTFLRGNGTEHYWIWAESTRESDYPFATAGSAHTEIAVTPAAARKRPRRHHPRPRRRK